MRGKKYECMNKMYVAVALVKLPLNQAFLILLPLLASSKDQKGS